MYPSRMGTIRSQKTCSRTRTSHGPEAGALCAVPAGWAAWAKAGGGSAGFCPQWELIFQVGRAAVPRAAHSNAVPKSPAPLSQSHGQPCQPAPAPASASALQNLVRGQTQQGKPPGTSKPRAHPGQRQGGAMRPSPLPMGSLSCSSCHLQTQPSTQNSSLCSKIRSLQGRMLVPEQLTPRVYPTQSPVS